MTIYHPIIESKKSEAQENHVPTIPPHMTPEIEQAAQGSHVPIEVVPLTADEIRHRILEHFEKFSPHMQAYHEYAERIAALSVQYHNTRLSEVLGLPTEEYVLLATLDARETPKSLDTKLAQLSQIPDAGKIKRIIFDRVKCCYYLFI